MKQLILAISLIGMAIPACKKTVPNHAINSDLYNAYAFKTGTYWIYQDSISGEVDSFVVKTAALINSNQSGYTENLYNIDVSVYKIDSYKIDWEFTLKNNSFFLSPLNFIDNYEYNLEYGVFCYPITNGQAFPFMVNDTGNLITTYSSYTINSTLYNNVSEIRHYSSINQGGVMKHDDYFYTCDNIGLIQIVFNHPVDSVFRNWKIIKYKIIK